MQKFKKGELVTLSSAGKTRNHNYGYKKGFGVIVNYNKWARFPYTMRWFNESKTNAEFNAKEYELKRYKV